MYIENDVKCEQKDTRKTFKSVNYQCNYPYTEREIKEHDIMQII